ncbi:MULTISPECIES: fimbrial biogenesis chaperone [Roseomonadaceae]|uniref:Molecular chaperone n=1 Tax=Falsiroseomonas oleicola TaxID=2801474 RepID=A0ABS6H9N8_9PROT|nr:fimbria/pilus periplasmic chaperone [Roseomonas oleicola]MBU8545385.1 molecular chaperone [Roseomonas oleicola]
MDPIMVDFMPGRRTATFKVTNRGGTATAAQIRLFAWSQDGDQDVLAPTADVLASPPMFEVAPDEEQVVRLVLRRPADARERTYRLILDEIPRVARGREVVVALRLSLPVIVIGSRPAAAELAWHAERGPGNELLLLARNSGARHVRVNLLEALLPRGAMTAQPISANPYVLSGMERRWQLPAAAGSAGRLRLRIQAGTEAPTETTVAMPG